MSGSGPGARADKSKRPAFKDQQWPRGFVHQQPDGMFDTVRSTHEIRRVRSRSLYTPQRSQSSSRTRAPSLILLERHRLHSQIKINTPSLLFPCRNLSLYLGDPIQWVQFVVTLYWTFGPYDDSYSLLSDSLAFGFLIVHRTKLLTGTLSSTQEYIVHDGCHT